MMRFILLTLILFSFSVFQGVYAQIDWNMAMDKQWEINSAGYPHEEKELDELYHKIETFKLKLISSDKSFVIEEPSGVLTKGKFEILPLKAELVLKTDKNETIHFHFLDLNASIMILQAEKTATKWWYLNLASHN